MRYRGVISNLEQLIETTIDIDDKLYERAMENAKGRTLGAVKETRILRRAITVASQATSRESVD